MSHRLERVIVLHESCGERDVLTAKSYTYYVIILFLITVTCGRKNIKHEMITKK